MQINTMRRFGSVSYNQIGVLTKCTTLAITNMMWYPKGKEYYEKKLKEGKTKKHAIRCLMERLASIIYGMLKSGKVYQNDYQKPSKKLDLEKTRKN